jgi:hypothetical protein
MPGKHPSPCGSIQDFRDILRFGLLRFRFHAES